MLSLRGDEGGPKTSSGLANQKGGEFTSVYTQDGKTCPRSLFFTHQ